MIDPPILVQLEPGVQPPAYLTRWHPEPFGNPALAAELGLDRWYVSPSGRVPANAARVQRDRTGTVATPPRDAMFPQQWNLFNAPVVRQGQVRSGADMDVDGLAAFELVQELKAAGLKPVRRTLAVLDSEMNVPPAFSGDFRVTALWNTVINAPNHVFSPACPHAIHVTSIAASDANNRGLTGMSWFTDVKAVQVLQGCFGVQKDCAAGVVRATDDGAHVINMSLQYGAVGLALFESACAYAEESGVVLVAASGNYAWTNQIAVPSSFKTVIGVGAIDRQGKRAGFSNAGDDLELCAPGEMVLGLAPAGYQEWSGTSMASPHVAGAAVMLRSLYPSLDNKRVRAVLNQTADDMGVPGRDPYFGFGRLNVYRAILEADPCYADFNKDGAVNSLDIVAFQASFARRQHRANCTGDLDPSDVALLSPADWTCFMDKHRAGCPQ